MAKVKKIVVDIEGDIPPYPNVDARGEAGKAGSTMGPGLLPDPTEVVERELSPEEAIFYLKHARFTDASGEMIHVGLGAYDPRRRV